MTYRDIKKKDDLTFCGSLFGVIQKDNIIYLYVEDDENYHFKMLFHRHWLKDLKHIISMIETGKPSCKKKDKK